MSKNINKVKNTRTKIKAHKYALGEELKTQASGMGTTGWASAGIEAIGHGISSGLQAGQINDMSHVKDTINQSLNSYKPELSNTNDLMDAWNNIDFIDKVSYKDVYGDHGARAAQAFSGLAGAMGSGNGLIGKGLNMVGSVLGTAIGSISAAAKANKLTKKLNQGIEQANEQKILDFQDAAEDMREENLFDQLSTYAADGGKIYIKPSKRGTFTAAAKSRGMGVQEFASKVLANKEDYSTAMVKKANFARNAAKWHDEGGPLFTNGGIWSNGLTFINNGDTHEQNPLEGVPMGIAPDGIPNLVEEGEVIYDDYVFSNRLKANKTLLDKYSLPTKYEGKSFAEITKAVSKESEERPNDPISKKGLEDSMAKLQTAQEEVREMKQNKKQNIEIPQNTLFDKGGVLIRKWADIPTLEISEDLIYPGRTNRSALIRLGIAPKPLSLGVQPSTVSTQDSNINGTNNFNWASLLRYAPVAVQGITALTDALGKTNKPDYSNPDLIAANTQKIAYKPVGNYLTYKPFDINYTANKLANQAAATRKAALDLSGGNRGTAMANLLAADLNAQTALGDAYVKSWLANREQEQKVEDFNRGTNMANSQMGLTADQANQKITLQSAVQQAQMREDIDRTVSAAKSQNLSNFLDSLQGIGREATDTQKLNTLIDSNVFGNMTPEQVQGLLGLFGGTGLFGAKGGKLKRNKRKGLTC